MKSKKSIPIPNKKLSERYIIDCNNVNGFKSNDNLPYINPNIKGGNSFYTIKGDKMGLTHSKNFSLNKKANRPSFNELKHLRNNFKRFDSIVIKENKDNNIKKNSVSSPMEIGKEKVKENIKKKSKFCSNKNFEFSHNNNINSEIESNKKNILTSKVIPKITNFEEINNDRDNNNNNIESNMPNNNKNKKLYKLKRILNNFEIKISLPEDEVKINKDSNKIIQVF